MKNVLRAPVFDKGKGTDSMINLSSSWSEMAMSQQEKVLHSGALEIEEVKQVVCMQWERRGQLEQAENQRCVQYNYQQIQWKRPSSVHIDLN